MHAVVLIDAAPGYEDAVVASLKEVAAAKRISRIKRGNYDMAVLLDVDDEAAVDRLMSNDLRTMSGVRGLERVEKPDPALLEELGVRPSS